MNNDDYDSNISPANIQREDVYKGLEGKIAGLVSEVFKNFEYEEKPVDLQKKLALKKISPNRIYVRKSSLGSSDAHSLPDDVHWFCRMTVERKIFLRSEICWQARCANIIYDYTGSVNNGGHSQFVGNGYWNELNVSDLKRGMGAIGSPEGLELIQRLEKFSLSDKNGFKMGQEAAGFGGYPRIFKDLDQVFYANYPGSKLQFGAGLLDKLCKWLNSIDIYEPLDDELYAKLF